MLALGRSAEEFINSLNAEITANKLTKPVRKRLKDDYNGWY